jgi:hypothetical protein
MRNGSLVICSSTLLANTNSPTVKGWTGGRAALTVSADAYGTDLHLEVQNYGGAWCRAHTSSIRANQVMALHAPAGLYRMNQQGSSVVNLFAVLSATP